MGCVHGCAETEWQKLPLPHKDSEEVEQPCWKQETITSTEDSEQVELEEQPRIAVIGAGFLGQRIVTELLLLGASVNVYDTDLVAIGLEQGQQELDGMVMGVLHKCADDGLLEHAGLLWPPASRSGPWLAQEGEAPRQACLCSSLADAAIGVDMVIEAVPDTLAVKRAVFSQAAAAAPNALLATNTLTLPLAQVQAAVAEELIARAGDATVVYEPRVVGLRFLDPVCFMPIVEITLTAEQMQGPDRQDLVNLLNRLRKSAFQCTVQGCTEVVAREGRERRSTVAQAMRRSLRRLRITPSSALCRQTREAKLRRVQQGNCRAARRLTTKELFGCDEERCCICLAAVATITNVLCGHCVMCDDCSHLALQCHPICPVCRCPFEPAMRAHDHGLRPSMVASSP